MARKSRTNAAAARAKRSVSKPTSQTSAKPGDRATSAMLPAFLSSIMLWAAFAPLQWSILAWVAPAGWLWIIEREQSPGRRGYFLLWLSGCLFWLAVLQGVRLAFWPLYFGWIALGLYLGVYVPLFVGLARQLIFRFSISLMLAAPISWVGLEWIRSYMLTGFTANSLGHTQAMQPVVLQIADQVGGVGVGGMMMLVSAALFKVGLAVQARQWKRAAGPAAIASGALAATLGYGAWRLHEADQLADQQPLARVLLIQENAPTQFHPDQDLVAQYWVNYLETTRRQAAQYDDIDLVVWPESTFSGGRGWVDPNLPAELPPDMRPSEELIRANVASMQELFQSKLDLVLAAARGQQIGDLPPSSRESELPRPFLLLGTDAYVVTSQKEMIFNSAVYVSPGAELLGRYDKNSRVMFGEYIPLEPLLGWLGELFGFRGIQAGNDAKSFSLGEMRFAPNICFESAMPRFVVGQVRALRRAGTPPDLLINLTNDSWFRGSSILDHHLACSIVCAIENRRPMLVAANTGITASIDGSGRLLQTLERLEVGGILAEPHADARGGLVQQLGYPLGWISALILGVAAVPSRWLHWCSSLAGKKRKEGEQ